MKRLILLVVVVSLLLGACTSETQGRVSDAQNVVEVPEKSNFFERWQVAMAETINDMPNRVFFWYVFSWDGQLMTTMTCVGRPASSTESLEPNRIWQTAGAGRMFKIELDGGQAAHTDEAMGMDGTYGEPVPFRFCITPEGHYLDVTGFPSIASTMPLTFSDAQADYDQVLEAKKLLAEQALERGECIDHLLNVVPCKDGE